MLIVDLLRHTSGLTYGFQESTNVDAAYRKHGIGELVKSGSLEEWVQTLATLPLEFSPGTAWNYSISTDILGYIVGKVSGMKFEDFLRTKIFKPLGMATGCQSLGDPDLDRSALLHFSKPNALNNIGKTDATRGAWWRCALAELHHELTHAFDRVIYGHQHILLKFRIIVMSFGIFQHQGKLRDDVFEVMNYKGRHLVEGVKFPYLKQGFGCLHSRKKARSLTAGSPEQIIDFPIDADWCAGPSKNREAVHFIACH